MCGKLNENETSSNIIHCQQIQKKNSRNKFTVIGQNFNLHRIIIGSAANGLKESRWSLIAICQLFICISYLYSYSVVHVHHCVVEIIVFLNLQLHKRESCSGSSRYRICGCRRREHIIDLFISLFIFSTCLSFPYALTSSIIQTSPRILYLLSSILKAKYLWCINSHYCVAE